jgi:hypothetical protein
MKNAREKARGLLCCPGFRSGNHCRERFGDGDHPDTMSETARVTGSGSTPFKICFPGSLMTWNRHRRHTQTGARI